MPLFHPTLYLGSVTDLTPERLQRWGVRGLILDVDNTLTTHDNPVPPPKVLRWLETMREHHIEMMILSNNSPERVRPFANILRMGFTANAKKPLPGGYRRAAAKMGLAKRQVAVVGDQIFTDVLGGNLFGVRTVLVQLIEPEKTRFFRLKRWLERGILKGYRSGK